ncbi:MAG: ATP-binding cassette domain-containing protein [Chitinophagaceae bacterium]
MTKSISPFASVWNLVKEENADIRAIYFFAVLSGLIQLSLPVGVQAIIGFVLGGTLSASLFVLIIVLVTGVLLAGIMQINQMKIIEKLQQRIFVKYVYAFADRIPQFDLQKTNDYFLPELVNRFFDTVALQKSLSKLLLDLPIAMIQIIFGLILLSMYHPFFILFGIVLLLILWLIIYLTGNKGLQSSLTESSYKYGLAGWFEEMARLVSTFKFSSATGLHVKKANEEAIGYIKARTAHFAVLVLHYRILVAFKVMITAALLITGVVLLLEQQINIGQFVAAEIIILTVINSVEKIIANLDSVYDLLTSFKKIEKVIDKPADTSGSYKLAGSKALCVEAQNLSFGYETDKTVINNVTFKILPGQKVCIVGDNGSGKTTLLKLLTGAYKEFHGSLLINDIPLGNYDRTSLRERTGILFPQENIFNGTVWENLTLGKAGIDTDYVNELSVQTGLNTYLSTLTLGYDTQLDPAGRRLPANVVQKILLIRALAHKPLLVLMEEPWLGIDQPYKDNVQQLLLQLKDTTVIITSNDESFTGRCNHSIQLSK